MICSLMDMNHSVDMDQVVSGVSASGADIVSSSLDIFSFFCVIETEDGKRLFDAETKTNKTNKNLDAPKSRRNDCVCVARPCNYGAARCGPAGFVIPVRAEKQTLKMIPEMKVEADDRCHVTEQWRYLGLQHVFVSHIEAD
ncbi:hypothetical protein JOB18_019512 [Solea senegalensis]|uniref:Uncharacterized protein n=1 Tax=Solea senegalensis TaxID=28829 RepID=A0AAV6S3W8_SOLSE|nr:hypothetical protein JOB18_019512 [Solea senegalensis]